MTLSPKYQEIVDQYQKLSLKLANTTDSQQLQELGQQLSQLQPLAQLAQQIIQTHHKLQETHTLLHQTEDKDLLKLAHQEVDTLHQLLTNLEQQFLNQQKTSQNKNDFSPAILEFRPAAGGDEAKIWVDDLKRMYLRFAQNLNLKTTFIDDNTLKISGSPHNFPLHTGPYGLFKYEAGVHRVQRIPVTESQGRIHTSTATVAVLPQIHPQDLVIKNNDLEWQFFRSGGHGGQNVNKVNTAVRLKHLPTGITVVATQERYQYRNKEIALELLRAKLYQQQEQDRLNQLHSARQVIGRGQRSEKIRTYNYPQNRLTDHRLHQSWYNLSEILDGQLTPIILTLHANL